MSAGTQTIEGRVVVEHKASYGVLSDGVEYVATVRGHFHEGEARDFPKVGDYVVLTVLEEGKGVIETVLPRSSEVVRKSAHDDTPQVIVANIDVMFIVMGLDADYNLRRLERYLVLAKQSDVEPVVILNKSDVTNDVSGRIAEVEAVSGGVAVHAVSAKSGSGMGVFSTYFTQSVTAVLLGSSGAGKSTITNYLLSETAQDTQAVRSDDSRGRHTTTTRELFSLPSGGFLIDTPGMRELGFVSEEDATEGAFSDVELRAYDCKFSNCDHIKSAGCAVQAAIAAGEIDQKHFDNYLKLQARDAETRPSRKRD